MNSDMTGSPQSHSRIGALSWICIIYGLLVVAIGVTLPIMFGMKLIDSSNALDEYINFYSVLFTFGLILFACHHLAAGTPLKICKLFGNFLCNTCSTLCMCCGNRLVPANSQISLTEKGEIIIEHPEKENAKRNLSSGRLGLKFGVKISVVVVIIMIIMELEVFLEIKLANNDCPFDAKSIDVMLFLSYIFAQTMFVLKTNQEDLEEHWFLNHLCVAHMAATTICLGVFMTTQDCSFKLFHLYFKLVQEQAEQPPLDTLVSKDMSDLFTLVNISTDVVDEHETNSTFNQSNPCSMINYVNQMNKQVKPFTYHFNMFYVYTCGILLILLFMHLRKQVLTKNKTSGFFKNVNVKSATFHSGAGLSLVVVSVITSILTIQAENNIIVSCFLFLLHFQATVVALIALCKISSYPCTLRKENSKYSIIFMIFYFFVVLISVFEAITKLSDATENPTYIIFVEIFVEVTDVIQTFLHGVLILVGYFTVVSPEVLRNHKMPTEILIHLAATNMASLASTIFVSESQLHELESLFKNSDSYADTNALIAWTVINSILQPAEEFNRFFTIVCLVKLHKIWSPIPTTLESKFDIALV